MADAPPSPPVADAARAELTQFFVNLALALGFPRSLGELYATLFCHHSPLPFDDVVARSGLSRGSASQGLRALQRLGAVHTSHTPGDRRTLYSAETSLRHLIDGLLRETILPHLAEGRLHLDRIRSLLHSSGDPATSGAELDLLASRVESLSTWNRKASSILPWIARLIGTSPPSSLRPAPARPGQPNPATDT